MSALLPVLNRALAVSEAFRSRSDVETVSDEMLALPERAVQFGTGAFLRGFVEHFLDAANRQGHFGGRVVAVGSTGSGRDQLLDEQDGLYTLVEQGMVSGEPHQRVRVIGALSRALSARSQWEEVLACARNADLRLIFSNTTEVGIALDPADGPELDPPHSFPGKLTRFLLERARTFHFDPDRGVVVLPCELIEDNGDRLRDIVLQLARRWELEPRFAAWLEEAVVFCNTLVDRIVPGTPGGEQGERLRESLGYRDELLTACEPYRLFAIQGDDALRERLGFAGADPGIVVAADIAPYRERKVRLLNGAHTITVPLALLAGCQTVAGALGDPYVGRFVRRVMLEEIAPLLEVPDAEGYARDVLDRFANPFARHELFDITLQGTMKMRVRVVPSILRYARERGEAPPSLAFGFAAYLLFMRGDLQDQRRAAGLAVPADDQARAVRAAWTSLQGDHRAALGALVRDVCAQEQLWGADLTQVPGWVDTVAAHLVRAHREGVPRALAAHLDRLQTAVA